MKNWKKIILLTFLTFCALGCTASITAHYPGKLNALDHQESGRTFYRGYTPPFPMDPPR